MLIYEKELQIARPKDFGDLRQHLGKRVKEALAHNEEAIRFVITKMGEDYIFCEVGVIRFEKGDPISSTIESIFHYEWPRYKNAEDFNIVLIIPTGVGCELGGHSGDGGAVARLFASIADQLVTHPNVVNAADINELPDNGLYVEGSVLSRLLMGTVTLQKTRSNRVLLVVDKHEEEMFHEMAVNAASAARASLGLDCPRVEIMADPILLSAEFAPSGRAVGRIERFEILCELLGRRWQEYDAVALSTLISVPPEYHTEYFKKDTSLAVNPWGGVEAMLTHAISAIYEVPSAHSPMINSGEVMNLNVGITDPRKAAEAVSTTYLHCVLKGLHRAPRILPGMISGDGLLNVQDISCVVIPDGCLGLPVLAAIENDIPVIAVQDFHVAGDSFSELGLEKGKLLFANNYLEAAGIASALKAGVALDSIKRPMRWTRFSTSERAK